MGVQAKVLDLDRLFNGDALQAALLRKTKQRTVPNVFVRGTHVGGNDNTQADFQSGRLAELLAGDHAQGRAVDAATMSLQRQADVHGHGVGLAAPAANLISNDGPRPGGALV